MAPQFSASDSLYPGHAVPGGAVLAIMFGLPLLLIFFKEPLTNLVEKKAEVMPKEKGMFIVQGIFELFEVILSYFSNTLSFVRIGAFAVSHAAMMEVVLMLAGAENGQSELDRHHSRKPVRMRYGGPDRRYPGTPSGILRNVQPFLQG